MRSVEISGLALRDRVEPAGLGSRSAGSWSPTTRATPSFAPGGSSGDELEPLWRRDGLAHAGHLILYPDTRELVVGDWRDVAALRRPLRATGRAACWASCSPAPRAARRASLAIGHDELVVLDLDSGEEKARVDVPSPSQGFLFPAPGFGRDVYYQSLTTIARVAVA